MEKAAGLEYECIGEGEPVLLVHGGHVADGFLPLTREAALADRYRLIRYRRRGYAGSDPVSGAFDLAEQVNDARSLLKCLDVERAHVVGHSYGGAIAVGLALESPGLVHSLMVLEPAILAPETTAAFFEGAAPVLEAYRSGDVGGAIDLFMSAASAGDWRAAVTRTVPGGIAQAEKDAATSFEGEIPALRTGLMGGGASSRIRAPVLYVLGGESGPLFESAMDYFASRVPGTEQIVLPGVNHLMQMRDPGKVAAPIAEFLARHPL